MKVVPWLVGISGVMVLAHCVGDSNVTDGGTTDATTDVASVDSSSDVSDAGADSGPVKCNVNKPFGAPTLITALVGGHDANLRLTQGEQLGFFASQRDGGAGSLDLWSSTRSDAGAFSAPVIVPQLNSVSTDDTPTASGDAKTMIFSSDRAGGQLFDLWVATRSSPLATFDPPSLLANVNSASSEYSPFLREDGQALYFASDRQPTQGQADIWRATLVGSTFGAPSHVDELASTGNDGYLTVTPDDLVIYFSSSRTGGLGAMDIWVATRASTSDPWSGIHAVPELNTTADDIVSFISTDLCRVYLASAIGGQFEIYLATRTP